jgi:hypothetical protein
MAGAAESRPRILTVNRRHGTAPMWPRSGRNSPLSASAQPTERHSQVKPPNEFVAVIDKKRYDVAASTLLAGDDWWDGSNFERQGRNTFLYSTPHGRYFTVTLTRWQGERDHITACPVDEAMMMWTILHQHRMEFDEAFPGVKVEEA